jgi:hypothetical protein
MKMSGQVPKNEIDQRLGERIVELRIRQKMPPDIVAEAARMSTEDYLKGERGERRFSAHELNLIARTIGVKLEDIMSALG